MGGPCFSNARVEVGHNFAPQGGKRVSVVIVLAPEVSVPRNCECQARGMEQIESVLSLA